MYFFSSFQYRLTHFTHLHSMIHYIGLLLIWLSHFPIGVFFFFFPFKYKNVFYYYYWYIIFKWQCNYKLAGFESKNSSQAFSNKFFRKNLLKKMGEIIISKKKNLNIHCLCKHASTDSIRCDIQKGLTKNIHFFFSFTVIHVLFKLFKKKFYFLEYFFV